MASGADRLDVLISTTYDNYRETLSDNITQTTPLLAALDLKSSVREDGGRTIRRPIMHALNSTVGSYSGYDTLDVTPQEGISNAEYAWTQLAGSVVFSGEEELKNMGSSQIIALIRAKFTQLEEAFRDMLSTQLWATSQAVATDLLSVPMIVSASGTIGGIDPTTETWWKSTSVASLDLDDIAGLATLNSVYNSLSVNGSRPDIEVTHQTAFEQYEAVAADKIRFTQTKLAELGFESLAHKGAELLFDPKCPASTTGDWYFLNSKHLEFVKHSSAWMKRRPAQMPHDQDASISLVLSMGQLVTDSRRAHGVILDTSAD
jgi:hypothetical protein